VFKLLLNTAFGVFFHRIFNIYVPTLPMSWNISPCVGHRLQYVFVNPSLSHSNLDINLWIPKVSLFLDLPVELNSHHFTIHLCYLETIPSNSWNIFFRQNYEPRTRDCSGCKKCALDIFEMNWNVKMGWFLVEHIYG